MILGTFQSVQATPLYLFGGGVRPKSALESFVRASHPGPILVITWATMEPDLVFASIERDLKAAGAGQVLKSAHQIFTQKDLAALEDQINLATSVFFTGGDQNLALDTIEKFNIKEKLKRAFESGKIFAGTSAGTALMPELAMKGGGPYDVPELRFGLGLTPYFVDQHFIVRDRELRLKKLVARDRLLGIGVDEGMCALIESEKLIAFGPTEVQIFVPSGNAGIQKYSVVDGQEFKLAIR